MILENGLEFGSFSPVLIGNSCAFKVGQRTEVGAVICQGLSPGKNSEKEGDYSDGTHF